jgi:D-beta-D-heptose 7-phosphate kinase/D-beta-D-heptose 1-phosphate adenosyltransferase
MDTQQQKQLKILVIGDSCEDIYHYGKCERISPEAAVPILKQTKVEIKPGMSANVVNNLKAFDASVTHVTNKKPIKKHRFVDERFNQHLLRVDEGENQVLDSVDLEKIQLFDETIDAVVISDYNKGFLSSNDCEKITKHFKNKPIFVDSKKINLSCFNNSIIKINESEHQKIVGMSNSSELIVTLGAHGALYDNKIFETDKVEVYDVCGAGDVFLSALTVEYLLTNSLKHAIMFANKCASFSVGKFGTHTLTEEEINGLRV